MSVLWRKSVRDLRSLKWQALGLALLTAIVTMLFVGGSRTRNMLAASVDHWMETLDLHDIEIMIAPSPPGLAPEVEALDVVARADERLLVEGEVEAEGLPRTPALVRVLEPGGSKLDRLRILEGRRPAPGEAAALVDRAMPRDLGLAIGSTVKVRVGPYEVTVPIVGSALSPEHLLFPVHPGHLLPLRGSVAVLHVTREAIAHLPASSRITSLVVEYAPGVDEDQATRALLDAVPDAPVHVRSRAQIPSVAFTAMIVRTFDVYLPLIAGILALIALCLLALTHAQLAQRQTASIGTLTSLGHGTRSVLLAGFAFATAPVALGVVLGLAVEGPFAHELFRGYSTSVGYAPVVDSGPGPVRAWVIVGAAVAALVCGLLPLALRAGRRPARLLHPGRRATAHGPLVALTTRAREVLGLPLSITLGLTTILRKRFTTLAAVLGLGGVLATVMAFLLVHMAHKNAVDEAVDRMGLDATVFFDAPQPPAVLRETAARVEATAEPFLSRFIGITTPHAHGIRRFLAVGPGTWRDRLRIAEGRALGAAPREIVIDRWIAHTHRLELGDALEARPHPNWPESTTLEVVGILEGIGLGSMIASLETGRTLFGLTTEADGGYLASALDAATLEAELRDAEHVTSVITTAGARASAQANFKGTEKVLLTSLLFAIAVAVLYLAILAALDARDRGKDLAILAALGWRRRTMWSLCLTEVMGRGILAVALALLAARPLAGWLIARLEAVNHYRLALPVENTVPWTLALGVLLALPLSAIPAMRVSRGMTPARALRALTRE